LVGASRRDLLKHGAHVLGVACLKLPPRVVSRTLGVAHDSQALTPRRVALILDGEQGNGSGDEARQVALTEHREGLVGNPLQSVIEVVACSRGELGCHARVGGVSRDVHVDLTTSMPNSRYGRPRYAGVPVWSKWCSTSRSKVGKPRHCNPSQ
jgi:hypothetical protein